MQLLRRMSSGIEGLDRVLNGGFVEGASYIIEGRPGAGKTILSNQVAFSHAAAGKRVLYVTLLSEGHERLFQALSTLEFFDASNLGQEVIYISVFQTLRDEGLGAVVKLLRNETQRHKATLLVFDGLLNARDRADTDLDVKTFVAAVQDQAGFVGCTVLFLTSTRLEDTSPEHTMVDGVIDLSIELVGVRTVRYLQVRKSRGSAALEGLHQLDISNRGITVYPRLESAAVPDVTLEAESLEQRVPTGCPSLDALINGGLPKGSITLLGGPTGSGKTTLGLHFLSLASPDDRALHFGFYEPPHRLRFKAKALALTLPKTANMGLEIIWVPLVENLLDKLAYQLLDHVSKHQVHRLFIDGLGGFERAAVHRGRLIEFFSALANELRRQGVTTVMTWEVREAERTGPMTLPGEMSAIIDNLIVLRPIHKDYMLQRTIAIQKMRESAFDVSTRELLFTERGLLVGAPLADLARDDSPTLKPHVT